MPNLLEENVRPKNRPKVPICSTNNTDIVIIVIFTYTSQITQLNIFMSLRSIRPTPKQRVNELSDSELSRVSPIQRIITNNSSDSYLVSLRVYISMFVFNTFF